MSSDGPGESIVVGDVLAGNAGNVVVEPGTCAYITTGRSAPFGNHSKPFT